MSAKLTSVFAFWTRRPCRNVMTAALNIAGSMCSCQEDEKLMSNSFFSSEMNPRIWGKVGDECHFMNFSDADPHKSQRLTAAVTRDDQRAFTHLPREGGLWKNSFILSLVHSDILTERAVWQLCTYISEINKCLLIKEFSCVPLERSWRTNVHDEIVVRGPGPLTLSQWRTSKFAFSARTWV